MPTVTLEKEISDCTRIVPYSYSTVHISLEPGFLANNGIIILAEEYQSSFVIPTVPVYVPLADVVTSTEYVFVSYLGKLEFNKQTF